MSELRIDYIVDEEGEAIPLLTPTQRQRYEAEAERVTMQAEQVTVPAASEDPGTALSYVEQQIFLMGKAVDYRQELLDDDLVRKNYPERIRTAVFTIEEPTGQHQIEVERAVADGKVTLLSSQRKAFELLNPRLKEGWEGSLLAFQETLEVECYFRIFPPISEKRRGFIAALRRSSGSEAKSPATP